MLDIQSDSVKVICMELLALSSALMAPEQGKARTDRDSESMLTVSELEDHNEALSISNEAELSNSLPGDDLDECLVYPGELCQHLCINTVGSYKCSCFPRFTLQDDGRGCSPGGKMSKEVN
uniref:Fibulin-2 n=1 Tax=Sphaerodactylus townsendi TaxID=933632 RepID=A0ACB8EHX6_9SAUR